MTWKITSILEVTESVSDLINKTFPCLFRNSQKSEFLKIDITMFLLSEKPLY